MYAKGGFFMNKINEMELQNLRHLILAHNVSHCKLTDYANEATDPAIKQFFQKSAQSAKQTSDDLMTFLG